MIYNEMEESPRWPAGTQLMNKRNIFFTKRAVAVLALLGMFIVAEHFFPLRALADYVTLTLKSEIYDGNGGFNRLNGTTGVFVSGNYAYVASQYDHSLTIIDISNPASPVLKSQVYDGDGEFNRLEGAWSVYVSGNYAYVASALDNSLTIMDISDPTNPVLKSEVYDGDGEFNKLSWPMSVFVSGNYAYVASFNDSSLTIMDISNPLNPVLKSEVYHGDGEFNRLGGAWSVYVSGNYAYVASYDSLSLTIMDISNPLNPVLKSEVYDGDGEFNKLYRARSVFVSGNYAYVASEMDNSLTIMDVSDPTNPVKKAELYDGNGGYERLREANGVFVSGNYAYVTGSFDKGVTVIDISDPASPVKKAEVYDGNGGFSKLYYPFGVFVSGNYVYVTSFDSESSTSGLGGLTIMEATVSAGMQSSSSGGSQVRLPYVQVVYMGNDLTSTSTSVIWLTDITSYSQIEFGTTSGAYTHKTALDDALVSFHTMLLGGLEPNTKYYFRVIAGQALDQKAYSSEYSFTTRVAADATALPLYSAEGMTVGTPAVTTSSATSTVVTNTTISTNTETSVASTTATSTAFILANATTTVVAATTTSNNAVATSTGTAMETTVKPQPTSTAQTITVNPPPVVATVETKVEAKATPTGTTPEVVVYVPSVEAISTSEEYKEYCDDPKHERACQSYASQAIAATEIISPASGFPVVTQEEFVSAPVTLAVEAAAFPVAITDAKQLNAVCAQSEFVAPCTASLVDQGVLSEEEADQRVKQVLAEAQAVTTIFAERVGARVFEDTDQDGITNYDEVNIYRTDPKKADSDGDGLPDGEELFLGEDPVARKGTPTTTPSTVPIIAVPEKKVAYEDPRYSGNVRTEVFPAPTIIAEPILPLEGSGTIAPTKAKITLEGRALPNSFVTVYIFSEPIVVTVRADDAGEWTYTLDRELPDGSHEVFSAITDTGGRILAKSEPLPFVKTAAAVSVGSPALLPQILPQNQAPGFFSGGSLYMLIFILVGVLAVALALIGWMTKQNTGAALPGTPLDGKKSNNEESDIMLT